MISCKYKCELRDAEYIINAYDSNGDRRLNYNEFIKFILPATNPELRNKALGRDREPHVDSSDLYLKLCKKEI
jgi:hypothetical protein